MKIAIIGESGIVGNRILEEAIHPRHEITAIVRDTSKLKNPKRINTRFTVVSKAE